MQGRAGLSTTQAGPEQAHATAAGVVAHGAQVGGEGARLEGGGEAARGELGEEARPVRRARVLRSGAGGFARLCTTWHRSAPLNATKRGACARSRAGL